jgi:hypothetical protein
LHESPRKFVVNNTAEYRTVSCPKCRSFGVDQTLAGKKRKSNDSLNKADRRCTRSVLPEETPHFRTIFLTKAVESREKQYPM